MSSDFYIPRQLTSNDRTFTEADLLKHSCFIVVLAEPGGGKTELMHSLAKQLNTTALSANRFKHSTNTANNSPLVIDAFDELVKLSGANIHELLGKASNLSPTHLIISSRSSEWSPATTKVFKEYFEFEPLEIRLKEFDLAEQQQLFDHHAPGQDFHTFQAEITKFDLGALLSNPQFLQLFAIAYLEEQGSFLSKRSIFTSAVKHLAKEANEEVATKSNLSAQQKISVSSEVFAKILLSGSEGVSTTESAEDRMYPALASFFKDQTHAKAVLDTRLFKLGETTNKHLPVHRIVAEYCAAEYLTRLISDHAQPLSIAKCLTVIAPNSVARNELRGLLGWMAALGNKTTQEAIIKLDPYAVLANGDPSQLMDSSKCLLIRQLKKVELEDPYFRRSDAWRSFSVGSFFTPEVLSEIKPVLADKSEGHLRNLILEILEGALNIEPIHGNLQSLVLSQTESETSRLLASNCLSGLSAIDSYRLIDTLILEGSKISLNMVADLLKENGSENFHNLTVKEYLLACSNLYPNSEINENKEIKVIGSRYFISIFISKLNLKITEFILDEICENLSCSCGKKYYECYCRNGKSIIISNLLDQYFKISRPPYDSLKIWSWLKNLNFHSQISVEQSIAAITLREDKDLRQGILKLAFGNLSSIDEIYELKSRSFDYNSHVGLMLTNSDFKFLIDWGFETDNIVLWSTCIARHQIFIDKSKRGPNYLRRHMRAQANQKNEFMQEWYKKNIEYKSSTTIIKDKNLKRFKKISKSQKNIDLDKFKKITSVNKNLQNIDSPDHFWALQKFSRTYILSFENLESVYGDFELGKTALRNCLSTISHNIPNLNDLADLACKGITLGYEDILFAACLEIMKTDGNLENVERRLLLALRTNKSTPYSTNISHEIIAMFEEADRLVLSNEQSIENYLTEYLEPQIINGYENAEISILQEEPFLYLRSHLSIEWLQTYKKLTGEALRQLFNIAAAHGNPESLNEIVSERCLDLISSTQSNQIDADKLKHFWLPRGFYFSDNHFENFQNWLQSDKNNIFFLTGCLGKFSHQIYNSWPKLNSRKVEAVLDAFISDWPELPSQNGAGRSEEKSAYRYLSEVIWHIDSDEPKHALPVLGRLLADLRYIDFHKSFKSMQASHLRKKALSDFEAPRVTNIVDWLDGGQVVTVEGLRELAIEELEDLQTAVNGGEFKTSSLFYESGKHKNENSCTLIIAERFQLRLESKNNSVVCEHQLKDAKRSDFTLTKMIDGKKLLLVTEVKGQWHHDLYTAAKNQLSDLYAIHPSADKQGVLLALWFGADIKVAGRKEHGISSAQELKRSIEEQVPDDIKNLIDVFVLDLSKS